MFHLLKLMLPRSIYFSMKRETKTTSLSPKDRNLMERTKDPISSNNGGRLLKLKTTR